jgi:non-homologous end joining protein Ku
MRGETRNAKRRKPEPKVIDLMEALKASVDDAKKRGAKPKRSPRRKSAKRSAA